MRVHNVYMNPNLVLNHAERFYNLKKCVRIKITRFKNGKNQAHTFT